MVYPAQTGLFPGVAQDAQGSYRWGQHNWTYNVQQTWDRWSPDALTQHAPNLYQWLPNDPGLLKIPAIILAVLLVCLLCVAIYRSTMRLSGEVMVGVSLVSLLLLPFTLPEMHERYFFAADVVSIIYAFYWPKRFFVPLLVWGASLLSYFPFLFREEPIGLQYAAILLAVALLVAAADLIKSLYPNLGRATVRFGALGVSKTEKTRQG